MANFVSNYGSHLAYHADTYFDYDLLKTRIYEIEEGVSHEVALDRKVSDRSLVVCAVLP